MKKYFDFEQPIEEIDNKIESLLKAENTKEETIKELEKEREELRKKIYGSLTVWQKVQVARHPNRPYTKDYIDYIFKDFVEIHGDRVFGDDHALICGFAFLDDKPVVVIGHQKGRTLQENMDRNFGMAHPEGYRKAMRSMKLAEKFNRPIITFIDTSGAYPGIAAEERGQAQAIAKNLEDMSDLKVPVISVVIGEGGSGGALGIGVSNRVLMLENSYYSVISPEGCAAILFRDGSKAKEAATAMKVSAKDLLDLKVIDEIIKEPYGGAHVDYKQTTQNVKDCLLKHLNDYKDLSPAEICDDRYKKFRNIGFFEEAKKSGNQTKKAFSKRKPKIK